MANAVIFCDNCGAMNPAGADYCEQCRAALYPGSPPADGPDDDGFQILTSGSPPTTPLATARARWWPGHGPPPATGTVDLDSIPVAPRRSPVGTDQQPPPVQLPAGMPAGLPKIELPKAPKVEPPKVEPPKGFMALFKPPPAPTGRKESGAPAPPPKIPKWMIALVAVLVLLLAGIVGAAGLHAGPFDDKPVTATAVAQQTSIAAIFVTQTQTADQVLATAAAQATNAAVTTGTALAVAAGTALAAEHIATQSAVQTALADKDAQAAVAANAAHATETALSNALAASQTQVGVAQNQVGVAQTAVAVAQATAHALDVQKSIQATMNALLTAVAPPPPPKPQGRLLAPPLRAARPSGAPGPEIRWPEIGRACPSILPASRAPRFHEASHTLERRQPDPPTLMGLLPLWTRRSATQ